MNGVPRVKLPEPVERVFWSVHATELFGEGEECLACCGARIPRKVGADFQEYVEDAALHEGVWPHFCQRSLESWPAITYDHEWGRNLGEERGPCGLGF